MKITIDTNRQIITTEENEQTVQYDLYSKEGFELISHYWLKIGWNQKYPYVFSWLGRPIIQIPEDIIRVQEVIYRVKPDIVIETGVAHGGSLIFYAGLCKIMDKGRVIGVDIEIRPHNCHAIETHPLYPWITLIEGSSTDPQIVSQIKSLIEPNESVLVLLDSNHTKQHVLDELNAYHSLVTSGSYLVATDGSMRDLYDVPRGKPEWRKDNPFEAVLEFVQHHPEFVVEQPRWPFNESELSQNITHWADAWLRRK